MPDKIFSNKIKGWLTPYIPEAERPNILSQAMEIANLANDNLLGQAGNVSNFASFLPEKEAPALVDFLKARGSHLQPIVADALTPEAGAA